MKKRLSPDELRDHLNSFGQTLAAHTRELEDHFSEQRLSLAKRIEALDADVAALEGTRSVPDTHAEGNSALLQRVLGGSFEDITRKELRDLCNRHGIKCTSRTRKADLIDALQAAGVEPSPIPVSRLRLDKQSLETLVEEMASRLRS